MKELNLVEILKDCPKGTKLWSPICGKCAIERFDENKYPIRVSFIEDGTMNFCDFTKEGRYFENIESSECVLFPSKDNRDWSTFRRPFKDGDVIITGKGRENECVAIFKSDKVYEGNNGFIYHSLIYLNTTKKVFKKDDWAAYINVRFATEEEKQKIFQAIKDNGYKWNPETKNVEKLEEEKPKWNPETLQPFDKVLVRDNEDDAFWFGDFFLYHDKTSDYPFVGIYSSYLCCIPYNDDTKHLLGTDQEAPKYYRI